MITKKSNNGKPNKNDSIKNSFYAWAVKASDGTLIIYNDKEKPYKLNNGGWTGDRIIYKGTNKDQNLQLNYDDPPLLVQLTVDII